MILISHRGNINGKQAEFENRQDYCQDAINAGYHVEMDIWFTDDWWTGHDGPQYKINSNFLLKPEVWCHAKNVEALYQLNKLGAHSFFHQRDEVTLTSQGYLWTYPLEKLTPKSICVLPEIQALYADKDHLQNCAGICSDFIVKYQ